MLEELHNILLGVQIKYDEMNKTQACTGLL